jgi:hypothetical protein
MISALSDANVNPALDPLDVIKTTRQLGAPHDEIVRRVEGACRSASSMSCWRCATQTG